MKRSFTKSNIAISILSVLYGAWAIAYIYTTSFTSIDGKRYFSLFDDAMISMRYGWNLFHGNGLAWNADERVEGITNLLMTLFMGSWTLFLEKRFAVLAVQISGMFFVIAIAYMSMRTGMQLLGERCRHRSIARVLFFAAPLCFFPISFWSLYGMETGMVTLLLLGALNAWMRTDDQPKASYSMAILLGFAFLTRPDTAIAISIILVYRLVGIFAKSGWIKTSITELAVVATFVFGVTLFRYVYYGDFLPNTYTLKVVGMPLLFRIENGLVYIRYFAVLYAPIATVALVGALLQHNRHAFPLITLFVVFTLYHITIGLDPFVYYRQLTPYVPFILMSFVAAIVRFLSSESGSSILEGRWSEKRRISIEQGIVILATCIMLIAINWQSFPVASFRARIPGLRDNVHATEIALALNELLEPGATLGLFHAGVIGYYTSFKGVDCLGKSDKIIASRPPNMTRQERLGKRKYMAPGHNKYDLNYSLVKQQPTYFERPRWGEQNFSKYAREHYLVVKYKATIPIALRKNSSHVRWEKLSLK